MDPDPSKIVTTANEIHIQPVGKVRIRLRFTGCHSQLLGPEPAWQTRSDSRADQLSGSRPIGPAPIAVNAPSSAAGSMRIWRSVVVAERPQPSTPGFEQQRQPAPEPQDRSGQARARPLPDRALRPVPQRSQGPPAGRHVSAPTSPMSRAAIGSRRARFRTTRGTSPPGLPIRRRIKPGNNMPATSLAPEDMRTLLGYLETLQ